MDVKKTYNIVQSLTRGLKTGQDHFKEDIQESIVGLNARLKELSYDNYNLVIQKDRQLKHLISKNKEIKTKFASLSQELGYFLKNHIYNEQKKKELQTARDNISKLKDSLSDVRLMVITFEKINQAVKHSQFTLAIKLIKKLDENDLADKMRMRDFSLVYSKLRNKIIKKLEKGVNALFLNWVKYCELRKKDISEVIESKAEGALEILYMNKSETQNDKIVGNLKAQLIRNSMITREGLSLAADKLTKPSILGKAANFLQQPYISSSILGKNMDIRTSDVINNDDMEDRRVNEMEVEVAPSIDIDMQSFSSVYFVKQTLNEKPQFMIDLKRKRKSELDKDLKLLSSGNLDVLRATLISITSFFLIESKLSKNIKDYNSLEELWESYQSELEKATHDYFTHHSELDNLKLKKLMHLSAHIFRQKNLQNLCDDTLNIIRLNFQQFYLKVSRPFLSDIKNHVARRGFELKPIANIEEYKDKVERFGFKFNEVSTKLLELFNRNFESMKSEYSSLVVYIAKKCEKLIEKLALYLADVFEYDYSILNETDNFLISVYDILIDEVRSGTMSLVEYAHISNDSSYVCNLLKFFIEKIEGHTGLSLKNEMAYVEYFQKLKSEVYEKLMEIFPSMIESFTKEWAKVKWEEKKPEEGPREFVVALGKRIRRVYIEVKEVSTTMAATLIYTCYKNVNSFLKRLFEEKISHYNMIGIMNLKADLVYLEKMAEKEFSDLSRLKENLNTIMQFSDFFLNADPDSILDERQRTAKYPVLSNKFLFLALPKYKKIVKKGVPKVRVRQIKAVIKELKKQEEKKRFK